MDPMLMDPMAPPAPPPTAPPQKKRRPVDTTMLPPDVQQHLASGQPWHAEDGSVVYPDGTAEGSGDSPDDYVGGGYDLQSQDWGMSGMNMGMDAGAGGAPPTEPADPFAAPQFGAYNDTVNRTRGPFAPPPTAPTGADIANQDTIGNPMGSPGFADPFADVTAESNRQPITINNGPQAGAAGVGAGVGPTPQGPKYAGRIGRRMAANAGPRLMGPRRR